MEFAIVDLWESVPRLSIDGGKSWRPPWVIHQFGNEAKDIGYPSTVALDKKGTLLTAFYTDYESTLKKNRICTEFLL